MSKQRQNNRNSEREPEGSEDRNKTPPLELDGVSFDRNKRLNADKYVKKYPDMQFIWENDMDGMVELRIEQGFEPQEIEFSKSTKNFPGLTDRKKEQYVCAIAGTDHGIPYKAYLLKIDKELYKKIKLDPLAERQQAIEEAMGKQARDGQASAEDREAVGAEVETYAPNLPTGGVGMEEILDQSTVNQIAST